ncbi:flavin-containing monooxygenase [Spirosoma rhododendri]|uniref:NAD(P)/FAD-dependent oxidoreductase n=1 Tax=Spirosoma rhododendri TaxID=2728024 RepID=A0A7L5DZ24_9BACT|nr:NAD(P)/FAD-dependent oxidoreductase [Spirosoma rhododendri]QJD80750.1 NAD(P)/FAD-dependent oxidoreductase [Spirosoma rhododendri]
MHTLIIGAGPAGLAVAGELAHRNLPFTIIEASEYVGYSWRQHYDRLQLHTVKEYSALPHFPFPASYPTYPSRLQVVEYLEQYAAHFKIQPQFNQRVVSIRQATAGWIVQTQTDTFTAERVVVAAGYNRVPNIPDLPGQRNFRGIVWHSYEYRNGAPFRDENVLVVGMGNTGAELALDLLDYGARPVISVRGPVNVAQRDSFGRPTQPTAIFMSRFPNWFYDLVSGVSQRLTIGDLSPYGLGKPTHPASYDIRRGKIPVIDVGTIDKIKSGEIRVVPAIEQVNARTVTFADGQELPFDAIVLATGYRPGLGDLLGADLSRRILNERGYPKRLWFAEPDLRGLYFVGYTTSSAGILYGINREANSVTSHIAQNNSVPA